MGIPTSVVGIFFLLSKSQEAWVGFLCSDLGGFQAAVGMVPLYRTPVRCVERKEWGYFNLASINSYFENYSIAPFWKIFGQRRPKQNKRQFRSCSVGWDCAEVKPGGGGERR